ncbi:hypothetical protein GGS20DRAFT_192318 [Poronia punctata]|nr:hypothetical protein GGS20DRAFT_192318 [Poronia punctata]
MAEEDPNKSYTEKSRQDRRVELARLARDRHVNFAVTLGLSFRINDGQAHFDYTGGIDTAKIRRNLASLLLSSSSWPKTAQSYPFFSSPDKGPGRRIKGTIDHSSGQGQGQGHIAKITAPPRAAVVVALHPSSSSSSSEHELRIQQILNQVNVREIANLSRDLLQSRMKSTTTTTTSLPLPIISEPFFGSRHIFYIIHHYHYHHHLHQNKNKNKNQNQNQKAIKWIMKIPTDIWDDKCRESLRTETFLLHTLRTETEIPVPEVIDADCNDDNKNKIGAPWLLMEFIQGKPLKDIWSNPKNNPKPKLKNNHHKRKQILHNLAKSMLQLSKYAFPRGGSPFFDAQHGRLVDVQAALALLAPINNPPPEQKQRLGPWETPLSAYTSHLSIQPPPRNITERGIDELLHLLISMIREPSSSSSSTCSKNAAAFVLAHPTLSLRDIILDEKDGVTIKAILGWDNACIMPRSLGNEIFPPWLVFSSSDPAWVLPELREYYVTVIKELGGDVNVTRQSLLTLTLDAAIRHPGCRLGVLRGFMDKCSRAFEELDFEWFVDTLGEGYDVDGFKTRLLTRNVRELVDKGFVKGAVAW